MQFSLKRGIAATGVAAILLAPPVGLEPTTLRLTAACSTIELRRNIQAPALLSQDLCWHHLSSRAVASQVFSARVSLTAVFGMGTGVSLKRIITGKV